VRELSALRQAGEQLGEAELAFAHDAEIGAQVREQFLGHDREAGAAHHDRYGPRASKRPHDVPNPGEKAVATGKIHVVGISERHAPVVRCVRATVRGDCRIAVVGETEVEQGELETRSFHRSRQVVEGNRRDRRFHLVRIYEGHALGHDRPLPVGVFEGSHG